MLKVLLLQSVVTFLLVGCASKKVTTDQEGPLSQKSPAPEVSSEPMNFDPQGSDSQKIEGLSTIHFDFNKSTLDAKDREILGKNANWMKAHKLATIQIEGHCDDRGSIEYNLALGERRAKSAQEYLVNLGVDLKQLSIISYGKEKPLTMDDSEEAQAKNRRDNFVPSQIK